MTKSDNDQSVNFTRRSAKRIAKVVRTVEGIPYDLRRGKRGHKSARGTELHPPWWPTVIYGLAADEEAGNIYVRFEPASVSKIIPMIELAGSGMVIGSAHDNARLIVTGGTDGFFAVKVGYDNLTTPMYTAVMESHADEIPADDIPTDPAAAGYFYIPTHIYYTEARVAPATGYICRVKPLFVNSLTFVRTFNDFRW